MDAMPTAPGSAGVGAGAAAPATQDEATWPGRREAFDAAGEGLEQQVVRVEANFLRLPLFALDNKHLRTMDGIRCEGTFHRAGQSFPFSYLVTRNARTLYPGPLARSAHLALLSLATDRGFPLTNPIVFTWRQLCGRMGIQVSGKAVAGLREALTATKGLMIESRHALYSKALGRPIDSREEHAQLIGVYDEVEFYGSERPDGSRVDVNAVWLSRWYLDNLNALYSAPLDFALWRSLDDRSPIASRLYEFLFFKFYGGQELLRFNYGTLVKFIPARVERYPSAARRQLQPAFTLLIEAGVLRDVHWAAAPGGEPQLLLRRGAILPSVRGRAPAFGVGEEEVVLDRIEDVRLPEWEVVTAFHRLWGHGDYRPAKAELELARQLLHDHGADVARQLLPRLVKRLKERWSAAKTFCAVARYVPEVLAELQREEARRRREAEERSRAESDRRRAARQAQDRTVLDALWKSLPEPERQQVREGVLRSQPKGLAKFPGLLEGLCLEELGRKHGLIGAEPVITPGAAEGGV